MPDQDMPAATPTESASVQNPSPIDLSALSGEQRQTWREKGELPQADSAPQDSKTPVVTPEASAPSSDTAPVSEPGKDAQARQKTKEDTAQRIQELLEDRKQRDRRIAELERQVTAPRETKQVSQPAPEAKVEDVYKPLTEKEFFEKNPKAEYSEYIDAVADHRADWKVAQAVKALKAEQEQSVQQREQTQREETINRGFQEKCTKAREKYADFDAVALNKTVPILRGSVLDIFVAQESEHGAEVAYYLGQHPEEATRITGIKYDDASQQFVRVDKGLNPFAQHRELLKIEAQFSGEVKDPKPVPPVSRAPKPVSEVGGRGTAPPDAALSAVKSGDVRGAFAEWNRQAAAANR